MRKRLFHPNKAVVVRFRTFQIFLTARRFHWQPVAMELEKDIERANRRIESVCFMVTGIASVVAVQSNGRGSKWVSLAGRG